MSALEFAAEKALERAACFSIFNVCSEIRELWFHLSPRCSSKDLLLGRHNALIHFVASRYIGHKSKEMCVIEVLILAFSPPPSSVI